MFERFRSGTLILLYHRVAPSRNDIWSLCVSPAHFEEHLQVLRKFQLIRLDRIEPGRWRIPKTPSIAITFDDGYADNLHAAAGLLKRYDSSATFFIATGYIGGSREFWWDELARVVFESDCSPVSESTGTKEDIYLELYQQLQPLSDEVRRERIDRMAVSRGPVAPSSPHDRALTQEELRRLAADDLFEIGAHTVTHPLLAAQPLALQRTELEQSKTWLETLLNRPVTSFSYPYGGSHHYTPETVQVAREAGFSRACTTASRPVRAGDQPFEWGRVHVPDLDGDEFQKLLFHFV